MTWIISPPWILTGCRTCWKSWNPCCFLLPYIILLLQKCYTQLQQWYVLYNEEFVGTLPYMVVPRSVRGCQMINYITETNFLYKWAFCVWHYHCWECKGKLETTTMLVYKEMRSSEWKNTLIMVWWIRPNTTVVEVKIAVQVYMRLSVHTIIDILYKMHSKMADQV